MKALYKILYPVAWVLMKIVFPFRITGRENFCTDSRLIVCGNHISFLDPLFLGFACGHKKGVHYMAKAELFRNKFFGAFISALGAFPVVRGDGGEAVKNAEQLIDSGKILGIFPEGTRSKTGKLGRMKSGVTVIAAATNASVQPIAIVCKNQKVRPFRLTRVIICKPIPAEEISYNQGDMKILRDTTARLTSPIAEAVNEYTR